MALRTCLWDLSVEDGHSPQHPEPKAWPQPGIGNLHRGPCSVNKALALGRLAWGRRERGPGTAGFLGVFHTLRFPERRHCSSARGVQLALGHVAAGRTLSPSDWALEALRVEADRLVAGAVLRAPHQTTAAAGRVD